MPRTASPVAPPVTRSATFAQYLGAQVDRPDAIGDLARDVAADRRIGSRFTYGQLAAHLQYMNAYPPCLLAFAEAGLEWHRATGKKLR